jgi:hypothetical protein
VRPARGTSGLAGRTLAAAILTLGDAAHEHQGGFARGGGLRGGRLLTTQAGSQALHGFMLVAGVTVSGVVRTGRFAVSHLRVGGRAAATGTLTLRNGLLTGTLGGRSVRGRLPSAVTKVLRGTG